MKKKLFTFLFAALMSVGMFAAQQVITWSTQFCHDVEAYYNTGQIITANNSKDGITVTYSDPANPIAVENGTKGGFSYTLYDNGLLEISGSGAMPNHAFVEEDFSADVKNIRFAKDCEVYSLGDMWFRCYDSKYSQLETVEINSVVPISFLGAGIFYKRDTVLKSKFITLKNDNFAIYAQFSSFYLFYSNNFTIFAPC